MGAASDRMRANIDAFNRRDFDALLAGLGEDSEWVPIREHPQAGTKRGPMEIREYLEDWLEMMDGIQIDLKTIEERGAKVLVVSTITGRSRQGDAEVSIALSTVTSFRDGQPVRHQEFLDPGEARRAFEAEKDV